MKLPVINQKTSPTGEILIVDDIPANLRLLTAMLTEQGYSVRPARSGELALMSAQAVSPDLILLDIKMSNMDGYEVCKQLKANPSTRDIPIIFISALDQTEDKIKAFTSGGVDYITKPFHVEEVLARVKTHLALYSLQRQLVMANAELKKLATTDPLTGLYNRRFFFELAKKELNRAKRYQKHFSLLIIDLDNFKSVNDRFGHLIGDQVLKTIADSIREISRKVDIATRYGGDEFAILTPETQVPQSKLLAERLSQTFDVKLKKIGTEIGLTTTLSIGIARFENEPEITIDTIFERADQALYSAKKVGRNCTKIWKRNN